MGEQTKKPCDVAFSAHARSRMETRGITLGEEDLQRLSDAVNRMEEKGARDALIYLNHEALLIVSVKNRTVVTVIDEASARENIFTNIDSTAIL